MEHDWHTHRQTTPRGVYSLADEYSAGEVVHTKGRRTSNSRPSCRKRHFGDSMRRVLHCLRSEKTFVDAVRSRVPGALAAFVPAEARAVRGSPVTPTQLLPTGAAVVIFRKRPKADSKVRRRATMRWFPNILI